MSFMPTAAFQIIPLVFPKITSPPPRLQLPAPQPASLLFHTFPDNLLPPAALSCSAGCPKGSSRAHPAFPGTQRLTWQEYILYSKLLRARTCLYEELWKVSCDIQIRNQEESLLLQECLRHSCCMSVFPYFLSFQRSFLKQLNLLLQGKDNQITKSTGRCTHAGSHLGLVKVDSIHRQLFCILKKFQVCLGWSHGSAEKERAWYSQNCCFSEDTDQT